jgi:hypothetical protein
MTAIRRPGAASAAALLALGASFVAAHALAPEWSRRAGLDVWNLPAASAQLRAAAEEREAVLADAERSARRREAANQTAAKLAAGNVPLPAATDEIAEIFRDEPAMPVALGCRYADVPAGRLRFARHTIDRATRFLDDDPDRRAVVLARLEAEYRAMCASPEPPDGP